MIRPLPSPPAPPPAPPAPRAELTAELEEGVCALISTGKSLRKACAELNVSKGTFLLRISKNHELAKAYAQAMTIRAHAHADEVEEIKEKLNGGLISDRSARALLDCIKWQTAKENPKVYGEKIDITGVPGSQTNVLLSPLEQIRRLKMVREGRGELAESGES